MGEGGRGGEGGGRGEGMDDCHTYSNIYRYVQ